MAPGVRRSRLFALVLAVAAVAACDKPRLHDPRRGPLVRSSPVRRSSEPDRPGLFLSELVIRPVFATGAAWNLGRAPAPTPRRPVPPRGLARRWRR